MADFEHESVKFGLGGSDCCGVVCAGVSCLDCEVAHTVKHAVDLCHRAFSNLHDGDAVLHVTNCSAETRGLSAQLLADNKAGCVVSCAVDAVT